MSEDLGKKIKQLTDILGQEKLPDNLKELLTLLTSSSTKEETSSRADNGINNDNTRPERSEIEENVEMIRKVKKIMDRLNKTSDHRVNLLTAIKPFVNKKRQEKISACINLLQISNFSGFINENDKNNFKTRRD